MYTHTHTHTHAHIHTHTHSLTHTHTDSHTHKYIERALCVCVCVCVYTEKVRSPQLYVPDHIYAYMYICIYAYVYVCMYIYIYIHVCVYTYTYIYREGQIPAIVRPRLSVANAVHRDPEQYVMQCLGLVLFSPVFFSFFFMSLQGDGLVLKAIFSRL